MPTVNIIGDSPDVANLARQEPEGNRDFSWIYSTEPTSADWYVVLGVKTQMSIRAPRERVLFCLLEPPEIDIYDPRVLIRYGHVLGPRYAYLAWMPNYRFADGLMPWRVGIPVEAGYPYDYLKNRAELAQCVAPRNSKISMVVSDKTDTPLQRDRVRLAELLSARIPDFEVFGRNSSREVEDTLEAFMGSEYTVAVENAYHAGWWTEKVGDPLLVGVGTIYDGHRHFRRYTPPGSICYIQSRNLEQSYRRIRNWLDSQASNPRVEEDRNVLRNFVSDRANLHARLIKYLTKRSSVPNNQRVSHFPAHFLAGHPAVRSVRALYLHRLGA